MLPVSGKAKGERSLSLEQRSSLLLLPLVLLLLASSSPVLAITTLKITFLMFTLLVLGRFFSDAHTSLSLVHVVVLSIHYEE